MDDPGWQCQGGFPEWIAGDSRGGKEFLLHAHGGVCRAGRFSGISVLLWRSRVAEGALDNPGPWQVLAPD